MRVTDSATKKVYNIENWLAEKRQLTGFKEMIIVCNGVKADLMRFSDEVECWIPKSQYTEVRHVESLSAFGV
jgi:hypothetical protein